MKINIGGVTCEAWLDYLPKDTRWFNRSSVAVTVEMPFDDAKNLFGNDAEWSVTHEMMTESGADYTVTEDMSAYSMAGPITDNRDGTVTAKMGKYMPDELMAAALHCVPESHKTAMTLRGIIEDAVQSIEDDSVALQAKSLYPEWYAIPAGTMVKAGMRIQHEGDLYKVVAEHIPSAEWIPGDGTESLYTRIDEVHSGTADDPIPYEGNMALASGLHYTQGGKVYRCTRDTINPVYNPLTDLVGVYVEVVA